MTEKEQKIVVKGCRRGNSAAQKKLYTHYSGDMFRVCLMYASDYDAANDLLQEGFLKVFQKIHLFKFKEHNSLGGWIRTVIVNTCVDYYRTDKWSKNKSPLTSDEVQRIHHDQLQSEANEESLYDQDEFLRIVKQLPKGYQVALNLFFLEGYTHKEIAAKLDISEGTSKSQVFKAKKHLRQLLQETLTEEELKIYEGFGRKVV